MRIFSNRTVSKAIVILSSLFLISIMGGCGSEKTAVASFPENCVAEDYPLSEDYLAITATAVRDNIFFYSVIRDISGNGTYDADTSELVWELLYMDFSAETSSPILIPYYIKDNDFIIQIFPNNDGTLDLVTQSYVEVKESGAPDVTETLIKKISLSGEEILSYSIMKDVKNQENVNITDFVTDHDENAYIVISEILYVWNSAGELLYTTKIPGSLTQMAQSKDGGIYFIWLGIDGFELAAVDVETGTLKTGHSLSFGKTYLDVAAGTNSALLLAASDGIYEYDIEQAVEKKIISFPQLDISGGFGGKILSLSNDRIAWFQTENNKNTLTIIRGVEEAELSQKKTLILGATVGSVFPWHYEAVAKFNKTSPDIRIEIKTYGSDDDDGDGTDKLNMDIANGQGPDIMILPRQFSMELYARKKVLTDLYPYIDGDEEMERSEFQENILQAYETDGELYGIPVIYSIRTMVASKSATGVINQWNLDEMIAFADQYMPDSTVFSQANKSHVLYLCLAANDDCLIDWSDEEQGFQRELLIKILRFADRFVLDDKYAYDERIIQQIQDNGQIQVMCNENIKYFEEQQKYLGAFGEPVSYPGYPSENGNGNLIDSNFVMAINSACENKDAAWQFISSLLSEESQWSFANIFGFPIRKSVLEQKIESEMKIFYVTDEDGINKEEKRNQYSFGTDIIDIYAAREEDVQAILDIINSADKKLVWDSQINNIIFEEAGAFFSGSKTVEEVVDIMENRIKIYIAEMK